MRDLVRFIQSARKKAGLAVDDRINLALCTDDPSLKQVIAEHKDTITTETLATNLSTEPANASYQENIKIGDTNIQISIQKA